MSEAIRTPYEMIGGADTLARLVDAFYDLVARHPDLAPLFPEDFTEVKNANISFSHSFSADRLSIQSATGIRCCAHATCAFRSALSKRKPGWLV